MLDAVDPTHDTYNCNPNVFFISPANNDAVYWQMHRAKQVLN